ncbi:MAG TPA: hypothetical protein VID27_17025 [Blastocatellia bacterium]
MKRKFALVATLALALSLPLALPPQSEAAAITITIYFGKPRACDGWGFCKIEIGWRAAKESPTGGERRAAVRKSRASGVLKGDKLYVDFSSELPERNPSVPISENLMLDASASRELGFKSVVVLKGDYKIDYEKNKFGSVVLNVEARN